MAASWWCSTFGSRLKTILLSSMSFQPPGVSVTPSGKCSILVSALQCICSSTDFSYLLVLALLTGQYPDNWESAFSNMAFFKFLGLSIAFGVHGLLCNYWKLYGLAFFMVLAVVPFAWLEVRLENIRKVRNITRLWPMLSFWWFSRRLVLYTYHPMLGKKY